MASCAIGWSGKERYRRVRRPPYIAPSIKGAGLPLFQALNTCQARDAFAVSKTSLTQIRRQGTSGPRNYRVGAAYTFSPKVPWYILCPEDTCSWKVLEALLSWMNSLRTLSVCAFSSKGCASVGHQASLSSGCLFPTCLFETPSAWVAPNDFQGYHVSVQLLPANLRC